MLTHYPGGPEQLFQSAPADRRHDDHLRTGRQTGFQGRALALDENVHVTPDARASNCRGGRGSRASAVQCVDQLVDRRGRNSSRRAAPGNRLTRAAGSVTMTSARSSEGGSSFGMT